MAINVLQLALMLKHCLILCIRDRGENSLLVSTLHPELGKQEFLAKGAKNIGAKLTPFLQPLHLVHLWLAPTRSAYPTIQEVMPVASYLPAAYPALKFALRVAQVLDMVSFPQLEARAFMRDTARILLLMRDPRTEENDLTKLWIQFELVTLSYLGRAPDTKAIRAKSLPHLSLHLERMIMHSISL